MPARGRQNNVPIIYLIERDTTRDKATGFTVPRVLSMSAAARMDSSLRGRLKRSWKDAQIAM